MYIWSDLIMSETTIEAFIYSRSFHSYTYVVRKLNSILLNISLENFYLYRLHFPPHLCSYLFIFIHSDLCIVITLSVFNIYNLISWDI